MIKRLLLLLVFVSMGLCLELPTYEQQIASHSAHEGEYLTDAVLGEVYICECGSYQVKGTNATIHETTMISKDEPNVVTITLHFFDIKDALGEDATFEMMENWAVNVLLSEATVDGEIFDESTDDILIAEHKLTDTTTSLLLIDMEEVSMTQRITHL